MREVFFALTTLGLVAFLVLLVAKKFRMRLRGRSHAPYNPLIFALLMFAYYAVLGILGGGWNMRIAARIAVYFAVLALITTVATVQMGYATIRVLVITRLALAAIAIVPFFLKMDNVPLIPLDAGLPPVFGLHLPYLKWFTAIYTLLIAADIFWWDICCDYHFTKRNALTIEKMYLLLFALILPMAYAVGFVNFGVSALFGWQALLAPLGVFLIAALPEEIFFRGFIQTTLERQFGPGVAIGIASIAFGFSHIVKTVAVPGHVFASPNWWYVAFATVAGLGYGYVYWRTRSLLASTILHFAVDITWVWFFRDRVPTGSDVHWIAVWVIGAVAAVILALLVWVEHKAAARRTPAWTALFTSEVFS